MLQRRLDLWAVETDRAVHAAVADEDDVVVVGEPAGFLNCHVGDAGAALEPEDRLGRMVRPGVDPGHRQRDQARCGIGPVLGNDERPAVGLVAAVLGGVGARLRGSGLRRWLRPARRPASGAKRRYARPRTTSPMSARPTILDGPGLWSCALRDLASTPGLRPGLRRQRRSRRARDRAWLEVELGSHSSHFGRYQFQSPSSFIDAGSSTRGRSSRREDRRCEPDTELLEERHRERAEDREDARP